MSLLPPEELPFLRIFDHLNLTVIDPQTYQIVQANDAFLARVALAPSEVVGRPCYEVILTRDRPCIEGGMPCQVQEAFREKRPAFGDMTFPRGPGQEQVWQIAAYPLVNGQGQVERVLRLEHEVTQWRHLEQALVQRSQELQKTQQQLEMLFEISRQVSTKSSLPELINFFHGVAREVFPASAPVFLILDAKSEHFLRLEDCQPQVLEPLKRLQQIRLEEPGLVGDFIQYLRKIKEPQINTMEERNRLPSFLKILSELYPGWFGLPIVTEQQCLGYFLLGATDPREYSPVDLHFFQALFAQVANHIHYLVLHEAEIRQLRHQAAERTAHGEIIGQSKKMQEVYDLIDLVSGSDATVLITGENGTGKELVAQAIHRQSHRRRGPFVVANCSAYSPTLLESELFGHERGAFTGAIRQRKGRIERAHGGTLFLDEIGDISPATQVLLLRFLQDHCFERVGGEKAIEADVRVLAASNKDLFAEVDAGRFRDDLYYRLNVIAIHLPALRERKEDIPLLAQHFLQKYNLKEGKKIQKFSANAMQALMDYDWPGNVRQLENAVSHAVIITQGEFIRRRHLPRFLRDAGEEATSTSLNENERRLILRVLQEANWNKHDAARRLQVSRSTLYSKIRRYGLKRAEGAGIV
jgi:transcriptional regulator with PAS, ATPase and Fis domain